MSINLTLRNEKGDELNWSELDGNFVSLRSAIESAIALIPTTTAPPATTTPAPPRGSSVGSAVLFERILSAYSHGVSALLTVDNEMYIWSGNRPYGHTVGHGSTETYSLPHVVKFNRLKSNYGYIVDGGINGSMGYALFNNGDLYTWGINSYGQLGTGDNVHRTVPVLVASDVTTVYPQTQAGYHCDYSQIFIKKSDGYLYGCGYNGYGKLGMGNTNNYNTFTRIPGAGTGFRKVWNLGRHAGVLIIQKADGTIWCSGYNGYGSIGNTSTTNQLALLEITNFWGAPDSSSAVEFTGGFSFDSGGQCHLAMTVNLSGGGYEVWSCGNNSWGQLGDGTTTAKSTPVRITSSSTESIIKTECFGGGPAATYCILSDGNILSWGYNGLYQLGNGTITVKSSPGASFKINGVSVTNVWSSGDCHQNSHYAAVFLQLANGEIVAAGYNGYGNLGMGTAESVTTFTKVLTGDHVITEMFRLNGTNNGFAMGAITSEKKLLVWGYNGSYEITPHFPYPAAICAPREFNWG